MSINQRYASNQHEFYHRKLFHAYQHILLTNLIFTTSNSDPSSGKKGSETGANEAKKKKCMSTLNYRVNFL